MLNKQDIKLLNKIQATASITPEQKDHFDRLVAKLTKYHTDTTARTKKIMAEKRKSNPYYGRSKTEIDSKIRVMTKKHFKEWLQDYTGAPEEAVYTYITSLQYDIVDFLDNIRVLFNVPQDYTDSEAIAYIEETIETILEGGKI